MSKVFISYSHKDEKWKDSLVKQLEVLKLHGEIDTWDDRQIQAGADWYGEIKKVLNDADAAVLMISADFLTSGFILNEEVPALLQRRAEENMKIFPLIVRPCLWSQIPWLSLIQARPKDGKPLSGFSKHKREKILADFALEIKNILDKKQGAKPLSTTVSDVTKQKPGKISLSKLPVTGPKVFGREKELGILDNAWADEHTHIVTLVAWGGVGKTALVNHWLNLLEQKNYCGAQKVYGWSFYSQGAKEGTQASADEFFLETLEWFNDPGPEKGSNIEKARRLAQLVQKEKCLLILDGLEPLQYPPGKLKGFAGQLKDPGLKNLLKELSTGHPGLCVITTREKVTDLSHRTGYTVKEILLEQLSDEAGLQLLENPGIKGSKKEILAAVQEYNGHALALTLLGNYIAVVHEGDIRKRDLIPALTEEEEKGGHARRVMESYEKWLAGSPELDILYMMGLFDRPVPEGAAAILKEAPVIEGVTENLQNLSHAQWQYALDRLRNLGLLARHCQSESENPVLDCHPLIREHFGKKLREQNPEGWKTAHKRLYYYYKALPGKELPDTLMEMEPLFATVVHGCQAGLHQEALNDVYWKRIRRGNEHYCIKKIGAFGSDLAALSHFFEVAWSQPSEGLTEGDKALVLSLAAFDLRAVGRLKEAIPPMQAGLEASIQQKDWMGAVTDAGNLSELMLTLGEVSQAVDYAEQSVTFADRSGDDFMKEGNRTTLADALHQSAGLAEAEKRFLEAEAMHKKRQPQFPFLYSLQGFRFCDLLLGRGKYKEVKERARQTLEWAIKFGGLLDAALNKLSLGRALLMQALEKKKNKKDGCTDFKKAKDYLDQAADGLRKAGTQHMLPIALFARAAYYRIQEEFSKAWDDLNEALEIAELGSMKLFLADYHLEAGRLCLAEKKIPDAKNHFNTAKEMIDKMGYHRRDQEVSAWNDE
ncbi:MAG: TIR domain-containing protein [Candidatus Aminicenantes bacterium]|nr:MAG: TIR domain-containing protein [Candidatus Aminicenantes bacterium]